MANNKMVECEACSKMISKEANFCVHCGQKNTYKKDTSYSYYLLGILFVLGAWMELTGNDIKPSKDLTICTYAFRKCSSQTELVEVYEGISEARVSCMMAVKEKSRYGEPDFGFIPFSSYDPTEKSYESGIISLGEPNLKQSNAFGAKENLRALCHYNLLDKEVTYLQIRE